jgi:hypothetical protein
MHDDDLDFLNQVIRVGCDALVEGIAARAPT